MRPHLASLILWIIGSAAVLFAADLVLFVYGTFNGCALTVSSATSEDLKWWQIHVGPVPDEVFEIEPPLPITGRDATWYHREGGRGADGVDEPIVIDGIPAFDMKCDNPMIRGRALVTNQQWTYRLGVALPLVFLERWYVGPANTDPGHPAEGWLKKFHFGAFALNMLLFMFMIDMCLVWFRRGRGWERRMRGRCAECAHILLPEQAYCPECGARS